MSEISLATLYQASRASLAERLGPTPGPQRVLSELRHLFESLEQSLGDAERPRLALESLRGGVLGSFLALRPVRQAGRGGETGPPGGFIGTLGGLLGPRRDERDRSVDTGVPTVDAERLLEQLRGMFEAADRLLAAAEPPPPTVVRASWAADAELLDLCQDLLEAQACDDATLALRHVERVRRSLPLRHGIDVVGFDGTNTSLFRFGAGARPEDAGLRTVRPALIAGDRVLRRGEVRRPVDPAKSVGEERGHLDG